MTIVDTDLVARVGMVSARDRHDLCLLFIIFCNKTRLKILVLSLLNLFKYLCVSGSVPFRPPPLPSVSLLSPPRGKAAGRLL